MPWVEQRHREAKTGPAVQEFKDDGSLKDMKGAVKHRERYRKKGAVRDSKSDPPPSQGLGFGVQWLGFGIQDSRFNV